MKLWKAFLIAISVVTLPFALVGVGQAQQMTCWCIKPSRTERREHTNYSEQYPLQEHGDPADQVSNTWHYMENEEDGKT